MATSNLTSTSYATPILMNQTPKKAFDSINDVSGWWCTNVEGNTQKAGDTFKVTFGKTWKVFKITEMVPNQKVVWEVIDCDLPWNKDPKEWKGTKVVWKITTAGNATEVHFTHEGLVPAMSCFDACSDAWGDYIKNSLRNLITTGKGQPS